MSGIEARRAQAIKDYKLTVEYKHLKQNSPGGIYVVPSFADLRTWHGVIFVRRGMYASGVFKFRVELPPEYNDAARGALLHEPHLQPLVDAESGELDVKFAYPEWDPAKHYVVTVLTPQKIFYIRTLRGLRGAEERGGGAGLRRRRAGFLREVEYAMEAVKQGSACLGIVGEGCVVLAALKRQPNELSGYQRKLAHSNAVVLDSLAMKALLTTIRRKSTPQRTYVEHCDRLCAMLAEEALARLPGTAYDVPVETPCGTLTTGSAVVVPERDICLVDIMRSGAILQEAVRRVVPGAKTAKILIQRDEETAQPVLMYSKLPPKIEAMNVLLCDPMLATGGSALTAIKVLKDAGVPEERITFANVVSCPEGLANLKKHAPKVVVVTSAVDEGLDARRPSRPTTTPTRAHGAPDPTYWWNFYYTTKSFAGKRTCDAPRGLFTPENVREICETEQLLLRRNYLAGGDCPLLSEADVDAVAARMYADRDAYGIFLDSGPWDGAGYACRARSFYAATPLPGEDAIGALGDSQFDDISGTRSRPATTSYRFDMKESFMRSAYYKDARAGDPKMSADT
ncbi:hypothetical protein JL720_7845 [Aureococcus anophagefferens]|nr:hypothetical protein JL720_7845 [Aureococcus anophagefferens]